ncbi:hypothetical protein ACHAWX_001637 [Stephanocyclus meneghinianus]
MAPRGSKKRRSHRESSDSRRQMISAFSGDDDEEFGTSSLTIASFNPFSFHGDFFTAMSSLSSTKLLFYGGAVVTFLAAFFDPSFLLGAATSNEARNINDGEGVGDALPHVTKDGKYHGRYPNSLLTLFYPFTLLRDVVLDQPVISADVPFFWHVHVSDELAIKNALRTCYGANLVELDTVEDVSKAKKLDLVATLVSQERLGTRISDVTKQQYYNGQSSRPLVITSPHIREAAELFSQDHFGRMFSFYRHPIDYDVHPNLKKKLPPEAGASNFLTRLLSDVHTGELGFKELGIAKQVIRQVTVTGTRDLMAESLFRIAKYFGWIPVGGMGSKESEEADDAAAKACIEDIVQSAPEERYADHNSPEWEVFYQRNKMDCQLYELARSTWRAQIQTIIPLTLQKQRAGEGENAEAEGKET